MRTVEDVASGRVSVTGLPRFEGECVVIDRELLECDSLFAVVKILLHRRVPYTAVSAYYRMVQDHLPNMPENQRDADEAELRERMRKIARAILDMP